MVHHSESGSGSESDPQDVVLTHKCLPSAKHFGMALPVDKFTGDPELRFEKWLPALQRAAHWNNWSPEEHLMQLAGHLHGRTWQEWNLLEQE